MTHAPVCTTFHYALSDDTPPLCATTIPLRYLLDVSHGAADAVVRCSARTGSCLAALRFVANRDLWFLLGDAGWEQQRVSAEWPELFSRCCERGKVLLVACYFRVRAELVEAPKQVDL